MKKTALIICCIYGLLMLISCDFPGATTRYYERSLSPLYWSADQQSIYAAYVNRKRNDGTHGYFIYKIDLKGSYTLLFESEGEFPRILDFDRENEVFYFSFRYEPSQSTQVAPSGEPAIYQIKDQQLTKFIPLDLGAPNYGYLDENKHYLTTYQTHLIQEDNNGRFGGGWGRYVLSDRFFQMFKSNSELVLQAEYLHPFYSTIFISSLSPGIHASYLKQAVYAWGDLDLEAAEISNVKELPEYSNGILQFWDWLSEDEILFSVIDEGRLHLRAVTFNLTAEKYVEHPELKRRGILSPDRQWIAYMDNQRLMISKRDGTQTREILNTTILPKGMAIGL